MKADGGFPDLERALENKLKTVDPSFKRSIENSKLSFEE
jgi:hypothetical protein